MAIFLYNRDMFDINMDGKVDVLDYIILEEILEEEEKEKEEDEE